MPGSDQPAPSGSSCRDASRESEPLQFEKKEQHNRPKHFKHAMALLILYVPLVIVPWILTCMMAKRPFGAQSYYIQRGFTDAEIDRANAWITAVNVLSSIGSLVTIPILSALIAQAAAVYSYKHKTSQGFRLEHLIALADRGWTDPFTLWKSWMWREGKSSGVRNLLHFAVVAIILGQHYFRILNNVSDSHRFDTATIISDSRSNGSCFGSNVPGYKIHAVCLLQNSPAL